MKTFLIIAILHTIINAFLMGIRYKDFKETIAENEDNSLFRKILFALLIFIVFVLFLLEIELASKIGNWLITHIRITKYRLYLFGLNIYFKPIVVTEEEGEKDLYSMLEGQAYYSIKKFRLFDVVYLNKKKDKNDGRI